MHAVCSRDARLLRLESLVAQWLRSGAGRLFSLSVRDTPNTGDLMAWPVQYFPLLKGHTTAFSINGKDIKGKLQRANLTREDVVIVGGGGLVGYRGPTNFQLKIRFVCRMARCVLWSPGFNLRHTPAKCTLNLTHTNASCVGRQTRDAYSRLFAGGVKFWIAAGRDFVDLPPGWTSMLDATCLHRDLSQRCPTAAPKNGSRPRDSIVLYEYPTSSLDDADRAGISTKGPYQAHYMHRVVKHLCSAEVVISSSYHGALWALFLGRRVALINTEERGAKMLMFPFPIRLIGNSTESGLTHRLYDESNLAQIVETATAAPDGFLQKTRKANCDFYVRLLDGIVESWSQQNASRQAAARIEAVAARMEAAAADLRLHFQRLSLEQSRRFAR